MNITQLEFKIAYYNVAVQHVSHNAMRTHPPYISNRLYLSLPPTRQDLIQSLFYSGDFREVKHELRFMPSWTTLIIGLVGAM